jgi:hypothetical protein
VSDRIVEVPEHFREGRLVRAHTRGPSIWRGQPPRPEPEPMDADVLRYREAKRAREQP